MITGLLEKHKLRDIIRVILMVEERRLVKEPTTPTSTTVQTEMMESVPRPGFPISKGYEMTNMGMTGQGATMPPIIPRRRFYDEDVWRQALAEM